MVSVATMIVPLWESVGLRSKSPADASLMRIAASCAGPTQDRNHLRRARFLGAQKGVVHAHAFNEPEACRRILIHAADALWAAHPGLNSTTNCGDATDAGSPAS